MSGREKSGKGKPGKRRQRHSDRVVKEDRPYASAADCEGDAAAGETKDDDAACETKDDDAARETRDARIDRKKKRKI